MTTNPEPTTSSTSLRAETRIRDAAAAYRAGAIDKWDLYRPAWEAIDRRWLRLSDVAAILDAEGVATPAVVRMRRADFLKMTNTTTEDNQ